jgi:hypothetical protein
MLLLTSYFVLLYFKVESERAYHQRVLQILDQLEGEVLCILPFTNILHNFGPYIYIHFVLLMMQMVSERQRIEASPNLAKETVMQSPPSYEEVNGMFASPRVDELNESINYFLAEVNHCHPLYYTSYCDIEFYIDIYVGNPVI